MNKARTLSNDMVLLPRLKAVRLRAALSQAELAKKAGVGRVTIATAEIGASSPYPSTVRKLARALNVKPSDLMAPEGDAAD